MQIKIMVAVITWLAIALFCIAWDTSVQPDITTDQAMRQMEMHTDGVGNKLANERRAVITAQHWPQGTAIAMGLCFTAGLFWRDVTTALKNL